MTDTIATAEASDSEDLAAVLARLAKPTGLGTSAARLITQVTDISPTDAGPPSGGTVSDDPAYTYREWGDGSAPPLYVPIAERDNEALAAEVDARLVAWARDCGFGDDDLVSLGKAGFGRLVMLTHTDCEDTDRLLLAAQLNAAWWAADDYYADDSDMGATPEQLPPRLALTMAAMDPVPRTQEFTTDLDNALDTDPILVALRSAIGRAGRYGSPAQVQRICYATFSMFVSWTAYAAWRHSGEYPPAWEYLAARQHDSFYTSMTLIDIVGGYELTANLFYERRIRRALFQAGTASVMVNDLLSVAKDAADEKPVCNMVLRIAAERGCSIDEAIETTVHLHNDLVRDFQTGSRELAGVPSVELQRMLRGTRAWMGGGFVWHNTNPRYA